ncbi:MAG: CARDB domain-containing protein, partial [Flavobacteriaceae bacterium]
MKKRILYLLFLFPFFIFSQQVDLFQQFNGRFDFTAFGNTLNESENPVSCTILTESSADFNLLPGQTMVSAHLYWAGSGSGDFDVKLNGANITAQRTFSLFFNGLDFFAAYADVTSIVAFNGQGNYTLSDLDLTAVIGAYCGNRTNFGGWSVIVIYEDPTLLLNQLSLFDGLEFVAAANPTLEITLNNIDVSSQDLAKIGFLAWEGDVGIANNETLLINGTLIDNPPLNPGDNAFNGTNSYTNSSELYNMDLDFYDIENVISPGDTSITINLTSDQDFVMINNIITNVNSEIPDATIVIDDIGVFCENSNIDINYTVFNVNSTAPLPSNTPIAFYADNVLVGQSQTVNEIPIGGSENGVVTLLIPGGIPSIFTLKAVVDDDGTGNGIVNETNENNNEFEQIIDLNEEGIDLGPDIQSCEGYIEVLDADVGDPNFTYIWFFNGVVIPGANDATYEATQTGAYSVEANFGICFVNGSVVVTFNPQPIAILPDDLTICDEIPNDGFAEFDLTLRDAQ